MTDVVVIGAGFVGTSVATHLALRGRSVTLIDKGEPGHGASFGNAGVIQREAVLPYAFPRAQAELARALLRRGIDISYHVSALPGLAGTLARYWWNSAPSRHARIGRSYATLIAHSIDEHARLIALSGADNLVRRDGWYDAYRTEAAFAAARAVAEARAGADGIGFRALEGDAVARLEPHLRERMAGAIHWSDPWTVLEPAALCATYAAAFERHGGRVLRGEVGIPEQRGAGWRLPVAGAAPLDAAEVVLATGAWSAGLTRALGYRLPLFVKRGYHMHYAPDPARPLHNWVADLETGYLLAPMRKGIRLTTGAELARLDAPATPTQLAGAEAVARRLFPLGERLDPAPWLGGRPCTADMLPVIGPAPRHPGLWFAFGHGHQGLTLGPVTGRLVAELITGAAPCVDPAPFAASRFDGRGALAA